MINSKWEKKLSQGFWALASDGRIDFWWGYWCKHVQNILDRLLSPEGCKIQLHFQFWQMVRTLFCPNSAQSFQGWVWLVAIKMVARRSKLIILEQPCYFDKIWLAEYIIIIIIFNSNWDIVKNEGQGEQLLKTIMKSHFNKRGFWVRCSLVWRNGWRKLLLSDGWLHRTR